MEPAQLAELTLTPPEEPRRTRNSKRGEEISENQQVLFFFFFFFFLMGRFEDAEEQRIRPPERFLLA